MELQTAEALARMLAEWRNDFACEEHRAQRVMLWQRSGESRQFRTDRVDIRWVVDRRVGVSEALEAWLIDLWRFVPGTTTTGEDLEHAMQVLLCPPGLPAPPLPRGQFDQADALELGVDRSTGSRLLAFPGAVDAPQTIRYQLFIPDRRPAHYRGRPSQGPLPWPARSILHLHAGLPLKHVIAQVVLLALRQGAGAQELVDWLVAYGVDGTVPKVREQMPSAVGQAVRHFVWPRTNLRRYLRRVARGLGAEGVAPLAVQEEAARLDVAVRTLYHWRAQGADDVDARSRALAQRRQKAELARLVSDREGITYDAARMRIQRQLSAGVTLADVAKRMLSASSHHTRS